MADLKAHRWNKIFKADGKTVIFAMDHAGAFGMMEGLEKPGEVVKRVSDGGADAILTTFGICKNFGKEIGNMGIVLRTDGGTSKLAKEAACGTLTVGAYDALRIGADAVAAMGLPGSKFEADQLAYLADLISQCTEWNIPVMVEALPAGFENPKEWWTPENIGHANRICAEMGADFLKTQYSGDPESFKKIVSQLYVPVVVLGGSKGSNPRDLLENIYNSIQVGANGVAVGRNIYQDAHPEKITAAIVAIVHHGATVDEAMKFLK
jgi:DhnA family fructose-bisphosphate aldolase class Ia